MKTILALVIFTLTMTATPLTPQQKVIRQMILEVQEASAEERFEKMNAFKQKLREMNAQDRKESIQSLQTALDAKNSVNEDNDDGTRRVRTQTQLQESQQQLQLQQQMQKQNQLKQKGLGGQHTGKKP